MSSPAEPPPQGGVQADPGQAARASPHPASPGALFRSFFAWECEAVVSQLSRAAEGVGPRWTIQEETLTPLEPPCSFLGSPDGGSPSRPVPEPAFASAGPPDPAAASPPCGEQSAGLAGASPGQGAEPAPAAPSPVSGLGGVSSWPESEEEEEDSRPPPSGANVTYECNASGGSANATYVCTEAPSPEEERTASAQPALEACQWKLPLVTSTPLTMSPPLLKDAFSATLCTGCPQGGAGSVPADPQRQSGSRVPHLRSLPAAASRGAGRVPPVSGKASLAKRSLSLGPSRALRARRAPGIGGPPKRTSNIPQPADGNHMQSFVVPPTISGSAVQSQHVVQKLLPDERTKTDLTQLPCNMKPPVSIQPPSKLPGRSGVPGSLAYLGLKLHSSSSRDDNALRTRLPVLSGNKVAAKTLSQKRPWEKSSDKGTASPLKQPFPKRSRLCKSEKEKPTYSDLMAVEQTPIAALEKKFTAPCSQCQLLAEENQRLKSMLETCQKTIAFLDGKQTGRK